VAPLDAAVGQRRGSGVLPVVEVAHDLGVLRGHEVPRVRRGRRPPVECRSQGCRGWVMCCDWIFNCGEEENLGGTSAPKSDHFLPRLWPGRGASGRRHFRAGASMDPMVRPTGCVHCHPGAARRVGPGRPAVGALRRTPRIFFRRPGREGQRGGGALSRGRPPGHGRPGAAGGRGRRRGGGPRGEGWPPPGRWLRRESRRLRAAGGRPVRRIRGPPDGRGEDDHRPEAALGGTHGAAGWGCPRPGQRPPPESGEARPRGGLQLYGGWEPGPGRGGGCDPPGDDSDRACRPAWL